MAALRRTPAVQAETARVRGQKKFAARPVITSAAATSFHAGSGSPSHSAEAPIPNTGMSSAMGMIVAAGWRASSQPHAA